MRLLEATSLRRASSQRRFRSPNRQSPMLGPGNCEAIMKTGFASSTAGRSSGESVRGRSLAEHGSHHVDYTREGLLSISSQGAIDHHFSTTSRRDDRSLTIQCTLGWCLLLSVPGSFPPLAPGGRKTIMAGLCWGDGGAIECWSPMAVSRIRVSLITGPIQAAGDHGPKKGLCLDTRRSSVPRSRLVDECRSQEETEAA